MPTSFDPYRQWLDIADGKAPPNHYRLLGLRIFEDNPEAISAAASRNASLVMTHLMGDEQSAAQKLLVEIETARRALLDPQAKAAYDTALRAEFAPAVAPNVADSTVIDADSLLPPMAVSATAQPPVVPAPASFGPGYDSSPAYAAPAPVYPATMPPLAPAAMPVAPMGVPAAVPVAMPAGSYAANSTPPMAPAAPAIPPAAYVPQSVAVPQAGIPQAFAVPQAVAVPAYGMPIVPQTAGIPQAVPQAIAVPQVMPVAPGLQAPHVTAPRASVAPLNAPMPTAMDAAVAPVAPTHVNGAPAPAHWRRATWRRGPKNATLLYVAIPAATLVLVAVIAVALNQNKPRDTRDNVTIAKVPEGDLKLDSGQAVSRTDSSQGTSALDRQSSGSPRSNGTTNGGNSKPQQPSAMSEPAEKPAPTTPPASTKSPTATPDNPTPPSATQTPPNPAPVTTPPNPIPATLTQPSAEEAAAQLAAVNKNLDAARFSMSKRDLAAAKRYIEAARKADTAGKHTAAIERVNTLLYYVEGFWNGVRESIRSLVVGDQTQIGNVTAGVVDRDEQRLVLRIDGQNQTYSIDELPEPLAYGLADGWFKKDDPASKIFLGAFYVVDPRGKRDRARALWQEASQAGKRNEVSVVLAELDVPLPTAIEVEPAPMQTADGKTSLPGATAQSKARGEVQQMFSAELAEAKAPGQRAELAARLLARADEAGTDATLRYVLISEAISLLARSADFDALIAAVEKQAELYAIDALDAKADALAEAAKTAEGSESNQRLARKALEVSDEAIVLEQIPLAERLVRIALNAARKGGNSDLLKECSAREKDIRELKKK